MISISIQDIKQNPQDSSNFYLANIYHATINPNSSSVSTSSPLSPPPFSPPNHALWVNALWFMSLVINLTCALLATLLQQWARRYLKITQSRYSPHNRARIRAFFAEGVEKCLLPWAVDALPTLLHLSLFLFFAGLVVFLCNINLTIFKSVLSWVGLCTALYGCVTCMPIIRHDSPYYTPLSFPTWHIVTGTLYFIYRFLRWFNLSVRYSYEPFRRFRDLAERCRTSLVRGMRKTAEETALDSPSEIDTRAFMWTFNCLDEDNELESFFSGLPGFCKSQVVKNLLPSLKEDEMRKLYEALRGLLERTLSSDMLPTPVKNWRALICAKAVDPDHTPINSEYQTTLGLHWQYLPPIQEPKPTAFHILDMILSKYQHSGPVAIEVAKVLRGWKNNKHNATVYAQLTISSVLATSKPRDDSWYDFASYELRLPKDSLRHFAAQGNSLSFIILIHLVRQQFTHFSKSSWAQKDTFSFFLAEASKFDATNPSSELQHQFCALWNQIVREAQNGNGWKLVYQILIPIRNVFLTLHHGTGSAPTQFSTSTRNWERILQVSSSYPVCTVPDHHSRLSPTSFIFAVPYGPNIPASVHSLTSPDPPSASPHTPLPADGTLTNALSLDNHSTSMPSPKSNASASSPAGVAVGNCALSCAPSDDLNSRSSPSAPVPVLDAILSTGLLPFQAATRPDSSFFYSSNRR